jgi:hypothetical protein
MSYREVIETRGDYRVVLMPEDADITPEYDGEPPLLRIERGSLSFARDDEVSGAKVREAFDRWTSRPGDGGWKTFEKYLRAYLGVTVIQPWLSENGNWYVAYDTPQWREEVGITDPASLADSDLIGDWRPYTNGDVWGAVVEKRVSWTTEDDDYDDRDTWERVEEDGSRWVLYGYSYAESEARELLNEFAPEPANA